MLQNLIKGKIVEWVVLLVALVALGLSIAAIAKPCKDTFATALKNETTNWSLRSGKMISTTDPCYMPSASHDDYCNNITRSQVCQQDYICVGDYPRPNMGKHCRKKTPEEKGQAIICSKPSPTPGPGSNCCDLKDPQGTCNSGYYCSQSEICPSGQGQCVPGTPCAISGNSCEHAPCCEGLTCLGGKCVGSTPPSSCDPTACSLLNCAGDPTICDKCGGMCEDGWSCTC